MRKVSPLFGFHKLVKSSERGNMLRGLGLYTDTDSPTNVCYVVMCMGAFRGLRLNLNRQLEKASAVERFSTGR